MKRLAERMSDRGVAEGEKLTTGQIAVEWHLHDSTVRRWVKKGVLPVAGVLPGGHYRIRRRDVEALLTRAAHE